MKSKVKTIRRITTGFVMLAFVFVCAGALRAESVFLKDGSIVEGKIITENDREIQLTLPSKEQRTLQRKDVLRTVYHEDYKQLRYIYLQNGDLLEGYIVDEDRESYTYRKDLAVNREKRIAKAKVDVVSKSMLADRAKKLDGNGSTGRQAAPGSSWEEGLVSRASRVRAGYGMGTHLGYENWDTRHLFTAEFMPGRDRNQDGNGFDTIARVKLHYLEQNTSSEYESFRRWAGEDLVMNGLTVESVKMTHLGIGAGGRYIYGWYFLGVLWQGYASALLQYSSVNIYYEIEDNVLIVHKNSISKTTLGAVGSLGIELGLYKYLGVYFEISGGYAPVLNTSQNLEDPSLLFGLTWRTSYL